MNASVENGTLTIHLEGKVDSGNAAQTEAEIRKIREEHPDVPAMAIDAQNLAYISSAGLRMILRFRKENPDFKVCNVSSEVYEIFDMTGFTEMMEVQKAFREMSVDGCEILGEGSNGVVYRYNPEIVVKVYRNPDALDEIKNERDLARKALILGIPTAIPFDVVKVGDKYASVFELLNAKSFTKLIREEPENLEKYVDEYVEVLKTIHSTEVRPGDMPEMKETAIKWVAFLKDYIDNDIFDKMMKLVKEIPDSHTMIHGDYHTNNLEMQNGEVLLIDMDTLAYGNPIFDITPMYMAYVGFGIVDKSKIENFLKLPAETAEQIWRMALAKYVGSDDPAVLDAVEEKAKVLGYLRLMRRTIRRDPDSDFGKKQIEVCREQLNILVPKCESLGL